MGAAEGEQQPGLLLHDVELGGERVDVRVAGGLVAEVAPRLTAAGHDERVHAAGGALIPGLHDHHIHLLALAAARASVPVGPPAVHDRDEMLAILRRADAALPEGAWIRAVGYHEQETGQLDRHVLDAAVPTRPVRVQHRSGAMWVLNSAGMAAVGLSDQVDLPGVDRDPEGNATGRLFRVDAWLAERLRPAANEADLSVVGAELASYGITGVTDATPVESPRGVEPIASAMANGALPQQVVITGGPGLDPGIEPSLARGPVKLLLHDHDLPPLDTVVGWVVGAHQAGRPVAVHCVTRQSLVLTLAAFEEAGTIEGDRVEHGAVIPAETIPTLRELGLIVVTQPNFVADRGDDYLAEVELADQADLWRCGSLQDGGVGVAGSTDAPFGSPDPWRAIAAAVERRTVAGRLLGSQERLPVEQALNLFLTPLGDPAGPPRTVTPGTPADLCLLTEPLDVMLQHPAQAQVMATIIGGAVRYLHPGMDAIHAFDGG